jgi:transposase
VEEFSRDFRTAFCSGVQKLWQAGSLNTCDGNLDVAGMLRKAEATDWEVFIQAPLYGPQKLIEYLGRYIFRIAISNHRILEVKHGQVTFQYYDNREGNKFKGQLKQMTLPAVQFIGRFLAHVLPSRFVRIRHFGLHHGTCRKKLQQARRLLGLPMQLPLILQLKLIEWLKQMKVDESIENHTHAHGLWGGISKGVLGLTWIAHMIMTGDHRKVRLNEMLQRNRRSLGAMLGCEIRASEFNDDRLGRLLKDLGSGETAEEIEREMSAHCLRYYRLPTEPATVRIDTTSVAVHGDDDGGGVIAYGYSKDHRPDLRQFKVLMATLDPLGMPLLTQLMAGNSSDDGCYVPAYEEAIKSTGTNIMVIGDSKMSALATRAHLHSGGSRYLTPLAMVGNTKADLAQWVDAAVTGTVALTRVHSASAAPIGRGYEVVREQTYHDEDRSVTVTWQERVLVMQSEEYARAQETGLRQRLTTAHTSLLALTARTGKGHRRYQTADALLAACQRILEKHEVMGLLTVTLECERQTRTVRARRGRPANTLRRLHRVSSKRCGIK